MSLRALPYVGLPCTHPRPFLASALSAAKRGDAGKHRDACESAYNAGPGNAWMGLFILRRWQVDTRRAIFATTRASSKPCLVPQTLDLRIRTSAVNSEPLKASSLEPNWLHFAGVQEPGGVAQHQARLK